jgi:triphosphatase
MFETELKFQIPAERAAAVRAAMARAVPRRQRLRALYVDTPGGELARAGIALRVRQEGPRWVQTLKARGAHAAERHEHNVSLPRPARDAGPPPAVPARHAGTPAAEAWAAALGVAIEDFDATRLQPVMETDILRRALQVADPAGGVVELAFDEGEIRAGTAVARVCELEYELVDGSLADLVRQAAIGISLHGLWFDTVSKAERGELLARQLGWSEPARFAPSALAGHVDGAALWRAGLASAVSMMLPNATALAAGSLEAEHVHQLRVGIRRLRVVVQELGPLVDLQAGPAWLPPLVDLFRALGAGRDEAALWAGLAPRLQAAGAPAVDWRPGDESPPAEPPGALVRAEPVQQALLALLVDSQAGASGLPPKRARRLVGNRLDRLHRQVARAGRDFPDLPEKEQHQARKRVKRLRYLIDIVGPLFGHAKAMKRYLRTLADAQDALGEHQDLLTALPLYRSAATRQPEAWFACGWLVAQQQVVARHCGSALRKAGRARRFW